MARKANARGVARRSGFVAQLNLVCLEDRLAPGDVLLTGLLTSGLTNFGDFHDPLPQPHLAQPELVRWLPEGFASSISAGESPTPIAVQSQFNSQTTTTVTSHEATSLLASRSLEDGLLIAESTPVGSVGVGIGMGAAPSRSSASASGLINTSRTNQSRGVEATLPRVDVATPPQFVNAAYARAAGRAIPRVTEVLSAEVPPAPGTRAVVPTSIPASVTPPANTESQRPVGNNDKDSIATTHHYLADGQPVGMNIHANRVAIGTNEPNSVVESPGLTLVRRLNDTVAVYEATGIGSAASRASIESLSGVAFTAEVFTLPATQSEAVVVADVIIALKAGVTAEEFFTGNAQFSSYRSLIGTPDQFVATVAAGYGVAALDVANALSNDSRVAWASPDFYQTWQLTSIPNDPLFTNEWHLNNTGQGDGLVDADVDMPEAWDVNAGGSSTITIAVVDDGVVINHPDLLNWVNPGEIAGDEFDNDGNGWVDDVYGWNFVSNNANASNQVPGDAHGTAVAGVAAARGDNGVGVAGAAYNSKVLSARIFNDGIATSDSNIATALYYSGGRTANGLSTWKSADVVNNSWGGGGNSTAINSALTWGTTQGREGLGATYFFATGNGFASSVSQPAVQSGNIPGVIAVGATNNLGVRSSYSNYGPELDIMAPSNGGTLAIETTDRPGADGYNTSVGTAGDYTGTGSTGFGGTSSATPLAAGIAALVLAQADVLNIDLTPTQLRDYLRSTTDLVGGATYDSTTGKNIQYGYGQLNAFKAVSGLGKAEIAVTTPTVDLVSGSGVATFVSVFVGQSSDLVIRVRNQGTETLDLTGLSIASGPFTIISPLGDTNLNMGESTTFTLRFTPSDAGSISRTVTLSSSDLDEASFTFSVEGTGLVDSIKGTIYQDWDGDGTLDANDPGIAGRTVYIDANTNGQFDTYSQSFANNTQIDIPTDGTTVFSDVNVTGMTGSVFDVNVKVNITHPYDADVDAYLVGPDGTRTLLVSNVGGGGANFTNTVLDDEAATFISSGSAPFTGSFRPLVPLTAFDGKAPNGTWRLELADNYPLVDDGTLENWELTITEAEPEVSTTSNAQGGYSFLNLANGTYTIRQLVPTGWTGTGPASATVTISDPNDSFLARDFGSGKNNRIYTHVFNDANGNGTQETGENPVAGRTVFLDTNDNGVIDPPINNTISSGSISVGILDNTTVTSAINVAALAGVISDIDVRVNATHTWTADLQITLISPTGTKVPLFLNRGGSGDNLVNTVFNDEAGTAIGSGSAPFTGSFRPESVLSVIDGQSPNGAWTLEIRDTAGGDVGTLTEWAVIITRTSEPSVITDSLGNAYFDVAAGSHNVRLEGLTGWEFTSPANGKHVVTAAGAPIWENDFGTVQPLAPTVSQVVVNGSTVPASNVTFSLIQSLDVTFNTNVTVENGAFSLTNGVDTITNTTNGGILVSVTGSQVTLEFDPAVLGVQYGSLSDGIWTLTTDLTKVKNATNQAGTGTATTLDIRRLYGDVNADGQVNLDDLTEFSSTFGLSLGDIGFNALFDINGDDQVNLDDLTEFSSRFGTSL